MKFRRHPDIEGPDIRLEYGFPGLPAEVDIIIGGFAKGALQLADIAALEGHQVVDALDLTEEAFVFGAEMDRPDEVRVPKNILHLMIPLDSQCLLDELHLVLFHDLPRMRFVEPDDMASVSMDERDARPPGLPGLDLLISETPQQREHLVEPEIRRLRHEATKEFFVAAHE